jgi:NAD(P)H-dependent FMN reductase
MPKLGVVVASTRPNRLGLPVAKWFAAKAREHGKFTVEWIDLKEVALPPLDEPNHPKEQKYQHEHTKAWSRTIAAIDAFAFVTPEYNYSMPPALANALDYLLVEWGYKPVGFVSYGGVSGGTRSVQMSKLLVTALRMVAIPEGVFMPFAMRQLDAAGAFAPGDTQDGAVTRMLDELLRWTDALRVLRA